MLDIVNGTQIVSAVASSGLGIFLSAILTIFGAVVIAHLVMDYIHYKHMENQSKQLTETSTLAVQSIQSMAIVGIAAMQGMDITDKIVSTPTPSADKKAQ